MQVLRKNYCRKPNKNVVRFFLISAKSAFLKAQEGGFFIYLHVQNYTETKRVLFGSFERTNAQLVELVDTLVSGTSGSNPVKVRVLYWARFKKLKNSKSA